MLSMTFRELEKVVLIKWKNIPQGTIQNLIIAIPRGMIETVRARGESTRFKVK